MKRLLYWMSRTALILALLALLIACGTAPVAQSQGGTVSDSRPNETTKIDEELLRPAVQAGGACGRFLVPPPGMLQGFEGADDAEAPAGVVWVRLYRDPGYIFTPLRRGADRAGAVLAVGGTREEAVARATAAVERIRFVTADADVLVET